MSAAKKHDQVEHVDVAVYDAWLFDMDGVLTNTASVHATAWKQAFDEFLKTEATKTGKTYAPFDDTADYEKYVDVEQRHDGVRNFSPREVSHCPRAMATIHPTRAPSWGWATIRTSSF